MKEAPIKDTSAIKAISRSAQILSGICDGVNTPAAIAANCKMSKSSVYRLLKALAEAQFIIYDPIARSYCLGDVVAKLASSQETTHDYLIGCAQDEMKRLAEISDETVNLSAMIGIKCVSLFSITSKNDLRVIVETGKTDVINAGAAGKVMLAQLSSHDLKTALKNLDLRPVTQYSVKNKEELAAQLQSTRADGFNMCANEKVIGSMGVAVPIKNYVFPVALSIVGPEIRIRPKARQLVDALRAGSSRVARNLENNRR
jgi:DNA-binding IclR family transcriptional regulator